MVLGLGLVSKIQMPINSNFALTQTKIIDKPNFYDSFYANRQNVLFKIRDDKSQDVFSIGMMILFAVIGSF